MKQDQSKVPYQAILDDASASLSVPKHKVILSCPKQNSLDEKIGKDRAAIIETTTNGRMIMCTPKASERIIKLDISRKDSNEERSGLQGKENLNSGTGQHKLLNAKNLSKSFSIESNERTNILANGLVTLPDRKVSALTPIPPASVSTLDSSFFGQSVMSLPVHLNRYTPLDHSMSVSLSASMPGKEANISVFAPHHQPLRSISNNDPEFASSSTAALSSLNAYLLNSSNESSSFEINSTSCLNSGTHRLLTSTHAKRQLNFNPLDSYSNGPLSTKNLGKIEEGISTIPCHSIPAPTTDVALQQTAARLRNSSSLGVSHFFSLNKRNVNKGRSELNSLGHIASMAAAVSGNQVFI